MHPKCETFTYRCIILLMIATVWIGVETDRFIINNPTYRVVHPDTLRVVVPYTTTGNHSTIIDDAIQVEHADDPVSYCLIVQEDLLARHEGFNRTMEVIIDKTCGFVLKSSDNVANETRLLLFLLSFVFIFVCLMFYAVTAPQTKQNNKYTDVEQRLETIDEEFERRSRASANGTVLEMGDLSDDDDESTPHGLPPISTKNTINDDDDDPTFDTDMEAVLAEEEKRPPRATNS